MRLTEFWTRMAEEFGESYAPTWAHYTVLAELGSRTVDEALEQGDPPKLVWRAVWEHRGLPAARR